MIASLESSQKNAEIDYEEAHRIIMDSENLRNTIQKEWEQFEEKREQLYKKAEEKAEKALQQAREEAEMIVDEIRQMKTETSLKEHEWIEAKKMLEEAKPNLSDRKSTRLNSSHVAISYAVFCLKKKKQKQQTNK